MTRPSRARLVLETLALLVALVALGALALHGFALLIVRLSDLVHGIPAPGAW